MTVIVQDLINRSYQYAKLEQFWKQGITHYRTVRGSTYHCPLCDEMAKHIWPVEEVVLPYHPRCVCIPVAVENVGVGVLSDYIESSYERLDEFRRSIPRGKPIVIPVNDTIVDKFTISRAAVKNWRSHSYKYETERNDALINIRSFFEKSEYVGWAHDEKRMDNGAWKNKHPNVKNWLYYKIVVVDEESYLVIQQTKDGKFIPYCLEDQYGSAPKVGGEVCISSLRAPHPGGTV